MPILTLKAIAENPWNAVTHELPVDAPQLLLFLACAAARYCWQTEHYLMLAVRAEEYLPSGWEPGDDSPDAHESNEGRSLAAQRRFEELRRLYVMMFGGPVE